MINIKQLAFKYASAEKPALDGISLEIPGGDFLGIIGPSGAGKSTLTYALNGVIPHHYEGDFYGGVEIDGMDTVTSSPTDIARTVGSVFQDIDGQMVASMVEDEMLFALENFGYGADETERRLTDSLSQVGIPELRHRSLDSLSGGQKQKVAIAATIALRPRVLVLDEPTGELDPRSSEQVFDILRQLNAAGTTIIVVEQKIMLLSAYCKRLAVMNAGQIALCGEVREVLAHQDELLEMGVNCPRVVSLAGELKRRGLYDGELPIDVDGAERMVREVLA